MTERIRIGALVSSAIYKHDSVRRKRSWLEALRDRAINAIGLSNNAGVRGNVVAADLLLSAFCKHASNAEYHFFTHPSLVSALSSRLALTSDSRDQRPSATVNSLSDVVKTGLDRYGISAWITPILGDNDTEGIETQQVLRSYYSSRLYPIMTLTHGLSNHKILYSLFLRMLLEKTYPCDTLVCTSEGSLAAAKAIMEHVEQRFNDEYGTRLRYAGRFDRIPLCVDTNVYRPQNKYGTRVKTGIDRNAFVILYLGKLSLTKVNLFPFVPVLARIVKTNPKIKILFVCAGTEDPGYTTELYARAEELGIKKSLKVILNVDDEDKPDIFAMADVFFSPSDTIQESFGLSPIEAMACGIPQIVSDWNGYRDTVMHGKTGFLIPTVFCGAVEDLHATGSVLGWMYDHIALGQSTLINWSKCEEYLQLMISNPTLREEMAKCSRDVALSSYSCAVVVNQYEKLARELIHNINLEPHSANTAFFSRPNYASFFGHYSTRNLAGEAWLLRLTPSGGGTLWNGVLPKYAITIDKAKNASEHTLRDILRCFTEDPETPLEMAALVLTLKQYDEVWLKHHVMWLLKNNLLQIDVQV
jgi:D-inositol-3-phosphate glycosyltransferase